MFKMIRVKTRLKGNDKIETWIRRSQRYFESLKQLKSRVSVLLAAGFVKPFLRQVCENFRRNETGISGSSLYLMQINANNIWGRAVVDDY